MIESLEEIVEELDSYSKKLYSASAELKKMILERLESEKQAQPLIDYLKGIDLEKNYDRIIAELIKIVDYADSSYSEKYKSFAALNQNNKIREMKHLLKKNISLDNINTEISYIELNNFEEKPVNPSNFLEDNGCVGGCGYLGGFIISDDNLFVCPNCAVIQDDKNFVYHEKRVYTRDEANSRKINEPRWRSYGPRTVINRNGRDAKNNDLSLKQKALFNRLSKIQQSLVNSIERNYWESNPKLNELCKKLNLSEYISESAWKIYSEAAKQKLTMGRTIDGFVAASIYASMRVNNLPKDLEEVIEVSLMPPRTVVSSLSLIKNKVLPKLNMKYKPLNPQMLVPKFANELEISICLQKQASELISYALHHGLKGGGKDPKGYAAAALYLVTKPTHEKKTQTEIAGCARITEVTLRTRAKQIRQHSGSLLSLENDY